MSDKQKIEVFIDFDGGKVLCICLRSKKKCRKSCTKEVVERDPYRGWEDTFRQNRYGKTK